MCLSSYTVAETVEHVACDAKAMGLILKETDKMHAWCAVQVDLNKSACLMHECNYISSVFFLS